MRNLLTMLLVAGSCVAAGAPDESLEKLRDRQDRTALDAKAAALHAEAAKVDKDADKWYRSAVAYSYAAEVAYELRDKAGSERAAEAGVADADKALALNGKNAEYHRILGTLCGQVIPANPIMGTLTYGKRAKEALDRAIELDPKSARARISHGVGNYYLPRNFGGGPEVAINDYKLAIALDPKSAEAYLWMGVALAKQHQNAQAREAFMKSLQLDPDRVWAKHQLDKTPAQ